MADTIVPSFDISRKQIADFVKDPRTIRDIEALARMLREQVPGALVGKVDATRIIVAGAGLTDGGDLESDVTLNVGAGTGIAVDPDAVRLADTAVTPGTYGDSTHIVEITVDQQGRITAASVVAISAQTLLDSISSTRGAILYRGASGWAALAPGTSGDFLETLGPGADPVWAAAGGGGGGGGSTPWWWSPPAVAGFSLVSGDATSPTFTADTDIGSVLKFNSASVVGDIMRCAFETITAPTAAWTYQARMTAITTTTAFNGCGLVVGNAANGHNLTIYIGHDGGIVVQRREMANFTATPLTITSASFSGFPVFADTFWKLSYDTTNVILWCSCDGKYWRKLYTEAVATYLLAAPDRVGFGMFTSNTAGITDDFELAVGRRVKSW